ncbi:hypothetical protein JCM21900_002239 [Sporobolomyces salmonicolor]
MRYLSARTITFGAIGAVLGSTSRTVKIVNSCPYTVWPAVSGFTDNSEPYSDTPGWEQKSGEFKSVTVPSTWNGRIWGRRACKTDSSGTLNCVAGGCSGGLDCGDGALGESMALELRLSSSNNGEYDVYDLQNGAGWRASGAGKGSYSGRNSITEADDTPTGTAVASPATLVPALISAASVEASTAQTAAQTTADAAASSASTTPASPSNNPSASSSSSTSTILGVSTPIFAGIVGGAVIVAANTITAICICFKKKCRQPQEGDVEVERDTATTAAAGQTAPRSGANPARTLSS